MLGLDQPRVVEQQPGALPKLGSEGDVLPLESPTRGRAGEDERPHYPVAGAQRRSNVRAGPARCEQFQRPGVMYAPAGQGGVDVRQVLRLPGSRQSSGCMRRLGCERAFAQPLKRCRIAMGAGERRRHAVLAEQFRDREVGESGHQKVAHARHPLGEGPRIADGRRDFSRQ